MSGRVTQFCRLVILGIVSLTWSFFPALMRADEARIIVISPHNEAIRVEFKQAFETWHLKHLGQSARVEWRDLGGSTDALRFVQSEFASKPDGIGIDCFFGGGLEPCLRMASQHLLAAYHPPPEILNGMPSNILGVEIRDPQFQWFGAAVSCFGILENTRVQKILGLPLASRWDHLAKPELYGWVGAGDPRNSGTMSTMYELLLQAYGWQRGWQVLTQLGGNVRKFDRFSSNTAKDTTLGETAYSLAIDFYAFTQIAAAGRSNLTFALPQEAAAVIPDGLAILKGAPHLAAAQRFVDFVLSDAGQKMWHLPRGHPEGPRQFSIERMSVRPALYRQYRGVSNIEFSPFELQQAFRYNGQLSRARGEVVAALIGALLVDTHSELQAAWRAVIRRGMRAADLEALGQPPISAEEALRLAQGPWKEPAFRNQQKLAWQQWAQQKYRQVQNEPAK